MKKLLVSFFILTSAIYTEAQTAYYSPALGKNGTALKTALHNIIKNHTVLPYPLWSHFNSTDNKGGNILWDIYSDKPGNLAPYSYIIGLNECGQYNAEGDCYNHEHLWPKSYFNDAAPMNSDLHHIYPTDGWVNNKRSNFPIGMVSNTSWISTNGSKLGTSISYSSYSGNVFEPIDSFKGDVARVFFYMSTRYEGEDNSWQNWQMANKAQLSTDAIALLLSWHHNDPVSQKEIDRNNAVYTKQGNKNPFIDYPLFADCIWGTADCTPLNVSSIEKKKWTIYPNPAKDKLYIDGVSYKNTSDLDVLIYNYLGQLLVRDKESILDISLLLPGIYRIEVRMKEDRITNTFIKTE